MYVVLHVPTGKYLRKVKNPNYYANNFDGSHSWNKPDRFLTDDISKARVYGNIGHVKNSIGVTKRIGEREWTNRVTGRKEMIPVYSRVNEIDPELWKVIELEVSIKEK